MMSEVPSHLESLWSYLGRLEGPAEGIPGSSVTYSLTYSLICPYTQSSIHSFIHHLVTKPLVWADPVLRTQMRSLPL